MSSGSLPNSLAHLIIREDPETGEITKPSSGRPVSADQAETTSSIGESSRLSRTSTSLESPFAFKERPSLPPLRPREGIFAYQVRRSRSPPRPQTSASPPLRVHDYATTKGDNYQIYPTSSHSTAYIPRSTPPLRRPFVEESASHQPHLPRRHSHQPYARPITGYQQPYVRPATSNFESYHPSSEIGILGGRGPISRTTKACDTCRTRKIRCEDGPTTSSGEAGPCMRCLAAGIECVFSGVQKKRGPCPGTTRPSTLTVRRNSGMSDRTDEPVSPNQQGLAPPAPAPRQIPIPSSARSSIGSINTPHLLTPPEDRRASYGFAVSPSSDLRHPVSAPIVPALSAKWPSAESPETRSVMPRLPTPKSGRSLFDADYHLGLRLPAIDLGRTAKKAAEYQFGPTSSTLAPILDEGRSSPFWQRAA